MKRYTKCKVLTIFAGLYFFLETKVTIVLSLSENDRMELACRPQILFNCRGSTSTSLLRAFEQAWEGNNIAF